MRDSKRYILAQVEGPAVDDRDAKHLAYEAVFQMLGEAGAAEAGFQFKEFNPDGRGIIVKCRTKALERIIAALAAKRRWKGADVAIRVRKVSGAISALPGAGPGKRK